MHFANQSAIIESGDKANQMAVVAADLNNEHDNEDDNDHDDFNSESLQRKFTKSSSTKIGEGNYGEVYRVELDDGRLWAMKQIAFHRSNEGIPSHALREICTLRLLDHPNIIKLHGVEIGPADTIYLYFDFLTTDLKEYLKARRSEPLSQQRFQYFSRQCLSGLTYLHCNSVIHRDLKPANLLIDCVNDVIKICDFGLARHFTFPLRPYTHEVITQWYRAPEIILGQSIYSPSVDVWSLGIIFAEMINGTPLFVGDSEIDQLFCIFKKLGTPSNAIWPNVESLDFFQMNFPKWEPLEFHELFRSNIHISCMQLLKSMIVLNPQGRASAGRCYEHKFYYEEL